MRISELKMIRVVCPDCGAGGASNGACFCHVCEDRILMLPARGSHGTQNWNEIARLYEGKVSTYSPQLPA